MTAKSLILIGVLSWLVSISNAWSASREEVRIDVGGYELNSILLEPSGRPDLPPIVFIHGASASLYDPMFSFRPKLEGRTKLLFIDRPGHGSSEIGGLENGFPDGQADAIAKLMDARGIERAIIVSHSFGGSVAAALAVNHPEKVIGLVFLSPAVYSWEGGVAWYNRVAQVPVLGWVFSGVIVPPIGLTQVNAATRAVFAPNNRPADYVSKTKAYRAIEPVAFHHNAVEISNLQKWAKKAANGYKSIKAPTIIITGDNDQIVSPEIHSRHLAHDIENAKLITIHNLGHKSDYVARDVAVAAILRISGKKVSMRRIVKQLEQQIANDSSD